MSNRLNQERQKELEPKRMEYAKEQIEALGYEITFCGEIGIVFYYRGCKVTLFPYSGWHTGASIKDGRGIDKLLKQIK